MANKPLAILLPVGGSGTRLRPHTYTRPKPLLRIGGQAMIGHGLDRFVRDLTDAITTCVFITPPGAFGAQFERWMAEEYVNEPIHLPNAPSDLRERRARLAAQTRFVVQPDPRGQADALWCARNSIGDTDMATLVFFPDTIFEADLSALLRLPDDDGALFVKEVDDPRAFGVAATDSAGYVTRVVEKPDTFVSNKAIVSPTWFRSSHYMYAAIAALRDKGAAGLRKGELYLADAVALMLESGARLTTVPMPEWVDCGTFDALLAANRYILGHSPITEVVPVQSQTDVVIVPPVWIDPRAMLSRCVVGPNVSLGACRVTDAVVRDAIIEDGATVECVVVSDSVIGPNAQFVGAPHTVSLGDTAAVRL